MCHTEGCDHVSYTQARADRTHQVSLLVARFEIIFSLDLTSGGSHIQQYFPQMTCWITKAGERECCGMQMNEKSSVGRRNRQGDMDRSRRISLLGGITSKSRSIFLHACAGRVRNTNLCSIRIRRRVYTPRASRTYLPSPKRCQGSCPMILRPAFAGFVLVSPSWLRSRDASFSLTWRLTTRSSIIIRFSGGNNTASKITLQ